MGKNNSKSRRFCRKALDRISEIEKKYPKGLPNVTQIGEEARAWIEKKIRQTRECLKSVWIEKGKPTWWEAIRLSRNKTAHQTEDFTDEEFSELCNNIFTNIKQIKSDLENNIKKTKQLSKKKRKFENFGSSAIGSEDERKQLVDAMEDAITPVEPKEEHLAFPKNNFAHAVETVLSEILNKKDIKNYAGVHHGLSENIQTDILEWLEKTQIAIAKENPFYEEAVFIERQKKLSAQELAADIAGEKSKIKAQYELLPSVNTETRKSIAESTLDFNFYQTEFSAQKQRQKSTKPNKATALALSVEPADNEQKTATIIGNTVQWKPQDRLEALRRNFIADMEKNLIERRNKWEQEQIEASRKQFLEELYKKIKNFMRLEKLLSPFIKDFGRLWGLSNGIFETSGFEILAAFAQLLEKDESLQELAAVLGKHNRSQTLFEKELRDKVVIKTEWHPKPAYRGEINGLRYSNDISSVLPSELAMLRNPAAKKLFQLKFAQKQLLSFDYQHDEALLKTETEREEVSISKEKEEPKGPIIICVDTSGSMQGTPENIAKTVTFALAKIAMEQERKCYLISFSTGIETLDLSSGQGGSALSKLAQFLQMGFNGGTDAAPALTYAVKMLQSEDYKNADVLMISDFVMSNLSVSLVKSIEAEKEKNTDFYSLVIGTSGNKNTIECFNHNWLYDVNDTHATRHLIEQLHELNTKNNAIV